VFKLDGTGAHVWSRRSTGALTGFSGGVAVDKVGNVTLVGDFEKPMDFGLGALPYTEEPAGSESSHSTDAFIVRFDAIGRPVWQRAFGGSESQALIDVALDPSGDAVVLGLTETTIDFGGGPIGSFSARGALARLDPTGKHVFSRALGGGSYWGQVAIENTGDIVFVGNAHEKFSVGGPTLESAGGRDGYIARYDKSGNHRSSVRFGGVDTDYALGVTPVGDGTLLVTGALSGTAMLGGAPVTAAGSTDALVLRTNGAGEIAAAHRFGNEREQTAHRTALAGDGKHFYLVGMFRGAINLGTGGLNAGPSGSDLFVAKCPL
jgi:hypothetical protein